MGIAKTYTEKAFDDMSKIPGMDIERLRATADVCTNVMQALLTSHQYVIVNAPTGFGKSILAMMLTKAWAYRMRGMIDESKNSKKSYILTSNLMLQAQYDADIAKFKLYDFAMLKGQSNYACTVEPARTFATRPCEKYTIREVQENLACGPACPYIVAREQALSTNTTVLNYNFWLTSVNLSRGSASGSFVPRGLTICDEAHLLADIVQGMFGTHLSPTSLKNDILRLTSEIGVMYPESSVAILMNDKSTAYVKAIEYFETVVKTCMTSRNDHTLQRVRDGLKFLSILFGQIDGSLQELIQTFPEDVEDYNDHCNKVVKLAESYGSRSQKLSFLLDLYGDHTNIVIDQVEQGYLFRCLKEDDLCKAFALKHIDRGVFMSATIGDIETYAESIGLKSGEYLPIDIASDFDFSKSPIRIVTPELSMSYANKTKNMRAMADRVVKICNAHSNEQGLIHTGNYEFMRMLEQLPLRDRSRMLFCKSAEDKRKNIEKMKTGQNWILVGPSLLEGIDLKDRLGRFQMFMKVPYASLADNLIKLKLEYKPSLYQLMTMNQVIQGIGRCIRSKTDWAVTYLLDSSFVGLFKKNKSTPSILNGRLTYWNIDNELTKNNIIEKFLTEQD